MKIWRGIFLNHINDLNIDNFGIHWTKDCNYPTSIEFFYNNISGNKRIGNKLFVFEAIINHNIIDNVKTRISNNEFPQECECVLKPNTILEDVKLINQEFKYSASINTGTRSDKW